MMSGACQRTRFKAREYDSVSVPTSRRLVLFSSRCKNSIGSSPVTMCFGIVRLIRSIIDASVVDLPLPMVPVTRIIGTLAREERGISPAD
jgi:hypothetical protein